jgi:hypothetical protein
MSDDSQQRRDDWREARTATTVTGEQPETHRGRDPRERAYDDLPPDPEHETARATHPSNAAPRVR